MEEKYLQYLDKSRLSDFLGVLVWTSLSGFMVLAKNKIGIDNITLLEFVIMALSLIGSKLAFNTRILKYKHVILFNIISETIFLIILYFVLFNNNLEYAGLTVYSIIIVTTITRFIQGERSRQLELLYIKNESKLRNLKKKHADLKIIGGILGTAIAAIAINTLNIDIILFTKIMLILNIIENIYDYYIWKQYLAFVNYEYKLS